MQKLIKIMEKIADFYKPEEEVVGAGYQIVKTPQKYKESTYFTYAVHEAYHIAGANNMVKISENPVTFISDTLGMPEEFDPKEDIVKKIESVLNDVKTKEILSL